MSGWFNALANQVAKGVLARGQHINNLRNETGAAFDMLPTEAHLKRGTINYAVATGSANTYAVTLPYAPAAYEDGMEIVVKIPIGATNTGASTINVNLIGAVSIARRDGSALAGGDLPAGNIVELRYNSTSTKAEIRGIVAGEMAAILDAPSQAAAAASSAVDAANYAAALRSTSTTSLLIEEEPKTFTIQADKQFAAGDYVLASSAADPANYMHGQVVSYSGTTLIVDVENIGGSGTFADWTVAISGTRGPVGPVGPAGYVPDYINMQYGII